MATGTMNWDDLRVVSAIYKAGSFARAAQALHLDETTIGRRLARIEAALGTPLFDATHGHRKPTEACTRILTQLAAIEYIADSIPGRVSERHAPLRRLRLSSIAAIADYYLAPTLPQFLTNEPGLILNIDTSDHNIDMSRWEADLAIRLGRPRQGTFTMRKIGSLRFVLVRPRDRSVAPLVVSYPDTLTQTPEMAALRQIRDLPPARLETADLDLIRRMLDSGQAAGMLPEAMAQPLWENPAVICETLDVTRDVWLLSQPHLRADAAARRVADWCAQVFA